MTLVADRLGLSVLIMIYLHMLNLCQLALILLALCMLLMNLNRSVSSGRKPAARRKSHLDCHGHRARGKACSTMNRTGAGRKDLSITLTLILTLVLTVGLVV